MLSSLMLILFIFLMMLGPCLCRFFVLYLVDKIESRFSYFSLKSVTLAVRRVSDPAFQAVVM